MAKNTKRILIAPSILSADFSELKSEIKRVESAGADWIHIDVMDGHFVPNITIGPFVIKRLRELTNLPFDVHLMIENPLSFIKPFADAGADIIVFHIETVKNPEKIISEIKKLNKRPGVSIRPKTPVKQIYKLLNKIDLVLIMTVEPGFAGQRFLAKCVSKIRELRNIFRYDIEIDGGINAITAKDAITAGANILVAGSYCFNSLNMKEAIRKLRAI